jgi:hypothetical protein
MKIREFVPPKTTYLATQKSNKTQRIDRDMYTILERPALSTSRSKSKIQTPRLWIDAGYSKVA